MNISELVKHHPYTNKQIAEIFACTEQGGMRKSNTTNTLVLISKRNNPLYEDYWEGNTLMYTGMGTKGDQSEDFRFNKTLKESNENGIKCHLFESFRDDEYIYVGRVKLCGPIFYDEESDSEDKLRRVVKFPLQIIDENGFPEERPYEINEELIVAAEKEKAKKIKNCSKEAIRNAAIRRSEKRVIRKTYSNYIERDQAVSQYTKDRAMGKCDLCKKEAPFFKKDGTPYLETHHVIALADNGPDVVYNTVALCPNCHRKLHIRKDKADKEIVIQAIQNYIQKDNYEDNIVKFKRLFNK